MAGIDYVDIPSYATQLPDEPMPSSPAKKGPEALSALTSVSVSVTSLPPSSPVSENPPLSPGVSSPTRSGFGNLPGMLLASSLQIPSAAPSTSSRDGAALLSTRDPLSVPIVTVNFRRFIGKVGPVFWLQDRIEEVLLWRKGWHVTVMWMAVYAFICYFPRLILLVPNAVILGIILASHPSRRVPDTEEPPSVVPPPRANAREGSAEWLANIQGIQNLMGAFADAYDAIFPYVLHFSYSSPYTPHILTLTFLLTLLSFPLLPLIPLRPLVLVIGLAPFLLTHPFTLHTLPVLLRALPLQRFRAHAARLVDDDRLKDVHWQSPLREVELFENERWGGDAAPNAWSKANLKSGERVAWTRGRDGWSGIHADDVSNLTFALEPGWMFVETEDWRADVEGAWSDGGGDDHGWVYTNEAWLDPHAVAMESWKTQGGMTRRRRWTRRIYLSQGGAKA